MVKSNKKRDKIENEMAHIFKNLTDYKKFAIL